MFCYFINYNRKVPIKKKSHFGNHLADLQTYPFENKFKRQKNGAETIKSEMLNIN